MTGICWAEKMVSTDLRTVCTFPTRTVRSVRTHVDKHLPVQVLNAYSAGIIRTAAVNQELGKSKR